MFGKKLKPTKSKQVYIAGPMTGMKFHNAPAFEAYKRLWDAMGWIAITPIELNSRVWARHHNGEEFDPYTMDVQYGHPLLPSMFSEDVRTILESDAIALMPGWQHSEGVAREIAVATLFNKEIYDALTCKPLSLQFNKNIAFWHN